MKLINFKDDIEFIKVKKQMGIPEDFKVTYEFEIEAERAEFDSLELPDIESGKGREILLAELEIGDKNEVMMAGRPALIYLRDQRRYAYKTGYKYHIAWCDSLADKKKNLKEKTYVVTRRTDGIFYVNDMGSDGKIIKENIKVKMNVCKKCLEKLNYNNYKKEKKIREQIYENFSLEKFLKEHDTKFDYLPIHTYETAPINQYTDDWDERSRKFREGKGWTCEKCGQDCSDKTGFLDTHHIDGVKSNNYRTNLKALCKNCHADEPEHEHYKKKLIEKGIIKER